MANLLTHLSKDSKVISEFPIKYFVYCFLLSRVVNEKGELMYDDYACNLPHTLKQIPEDDITEALNDLAASNYIQLRDDDIIVGTDVDGVKRLFNGKTVKSVNSFARIEKDYEIFLRAMKHSNKLYEVERIGDKISKLKRKDPAKWIFADFIDLFKITYECCFQEFIKDFQAKEYAQMKNLFKTTDVSALIQMVVHYVQNYENFHKSLPTVGLLLYHKNTIYSQITKSQKRETSRHVRDDSDF